MLRRFLYLNETAVDSYIGVIEGGLSDETTRKRSQRGSKGVEGGVGAKVATAKLAGQREHNEEDQSVVRDTPEHRFDRLLGTVEADEERWGYERVLDLADAFERLVTGMLISIDCEIEVPEMSRLLAQPDQLNGMLDVMEELAPVVAGSSLDSVGGGGCRVW